MTISHVELHASRIELAPLVELFPSVGFVRTTGPRANAIDGSRWRSDSFDFWQFDRSIDQLAKYGAPLAITATEDAFAVTHEILTRAQRALWRRTGVAATAWFLRVLDLHAAMHDVGRPLVRADLDHAIDTWQWTLRLDPRAPAEVQLAALCHDIERLDSEPDRRTEQLAPDYQAFKDAHAIGSARRAAALFERAGVPPPIAALAVHRIAHHEHAAGDPVADADALSFFSLNAVGYASYFGPAQTARKVEYTYRRLSPRARRELAGLRVPAAVAEQLAELGRSS